MNDVIRMAVTHDAEAIQAIYAPIVRETVISFELEPPGVDEMRHRIEYTVRQFPWLVLHRGGEIMGYAYAGKHRERTAYQWSVDVSVYVAPQFRRAGVGRALYVSLLELLKRQGYFNAYAGITLPNPASVALHESVGFRPLAVYRRVGYKHGAWHDVGWWEQQLQPPQPEPRLPVSIDKVTG